MRWSERREGDSYRAKFFRFKDRVLSKEPPIKEIIENHEMMDMEILKDLQSACLKIEDDPDSEEAYREACTALRRYRMLLLAMGADCPPYVDPE